MDKLVVAIWLAAFVASGQEPSGHETHTVAGTVVNTLTGEPIRRALVSAPTGGRPTAQLTGPDGRFQIEDVPEGTCLLNATKPGFVAKSGQEATVPIRVKSDTKDVTIKLQPTASIAGRITDADGNPIEQVNVQIFVEDLSQGRKSWQPRTTVTTDEDGAFSADGLEPGKPLVILSMGSDVPETRASKVQEVYAPRFYPDAPDIASAQVIDLQAGQQLEVDFKSHQEPGYTVTGTITGPSGDAGGLMLENESGQAVSQIEAQIDPKSGRFTMKGVPSGTWKLVLWGAQTISQTPFASTGLTVDHADVSGVVLTAAATVSIPATVVSPEADGKDQEPGSLARQQVAVMLTPVNPDSSHGSFVPVSNQEGGRLEFKDVMPGEYRVEVANQGRVCVGGVTQGSTDLTREYLTVEGKTNPQPITVEVRQDCAKLAVHFKDQEKSAGIPVIVVLSSAPAATPLLWQVMPNSTPDVMTLAAGTYQVFAFSSVDGLEYANPDALRKYHGEEVTLDAREHKDVEIDVIDRSQE